MPNQEGLQWFLDNIWDKLLERFPRLQLHIAGRNTPNHMHHRRLKNVTIHGEVPNALDFINQHSLMVVPLLSGSGMRVKILEGMALGKVVLTSSLGLEGIEAENKEEVLVADTVEEFIQAVAYCYQQKDKLVHLGQRAQVYVAREYDNLEIGRKLVRIYQKMTKVAMPRPRKVKRELPIG